MTDERKLLTVTFDEADALVIEALAGIGLVTILSGKPSTGLGVTLGGGQKPELVIPTLIAFDEDSFEEIRCLTAQAAGLPCPVHDIPDEKRIDLTQAIVTERMSEMKARASRIGKALGDFDKTFREEQVAQFMEAHPLVDRRK